MRRILYALVVSTIALTSLVRSQTPTVSVTKTTPASVSAKSEPQPVKAVEDCACESQVLPEALAIVNGVRITARDIEKATGDSVRQLQHQVVEARKRELDLLINSRLLSVEAKKRGASELALDRPRFDSALDSGELAVMVQRDIEEGMKLGINATPTVFINGRRMSAKSL
jgi:hypothetical protein